MRASKMMDLREATACLDEYRASLANIGAMLRLNVAEGELGEAIGRLNDGLVATLRAQTKEARILSNLILEEMNAKHEQMLDFPDQLTDLWTALNQIKIAIDKAAAQSEFLRKAAANTADVTESPGAKAIREFRRKRGL
jgi:hypothetical protein